MLSLTLKFFVPTLELNLSQYWNWLYQYRRCLKGAELLTPRAAVTAQQVRFITATDLIYLQIKCNGIAFLSISILTLKTSKTVPSILVGAHEVSFLTAISVLHNSRWTLCCVNTSKCQAVGRLFQRHTASWALFSPFFFFYYDVFLFFFITAPEKWNLRFKVILVNIKKAKNIKIKRQQHIGWWVGRGAGPSTVNHRAI